MYSRTAALVAAGVLVMSGLATGTANAAAPFTDAVEIRNNLDSGTNGHWAWVNHRRSVSITKTGVADTYRVVLTDSGTLRTIRGAKSPQAGVTIPREVSGAFSGRYTFTVTSPSGPSATGVANRMDYGCQIGGTCARKISSDSWPMLYFGEGAQVTPHKDWRWVYTTCSERWVNSAAGNAGDITGKRCERREEADAPSVAQPECDAAKGKLVIPSDRGVTYKVRTQGRDYRTVRAGEYDVRPGTYWVRAYAKPGVKLVGVDRWRLEVEAAEVCPTPTPTTTATGEPTAAPTPDPTVEPEPTEEPTEEPEPQPTVTETETRTTTKVVVVGNVRVPGRVDTGAGGLVTAAK